jgi:hypothetical protein
LSSTHCRAGLGVQRLPGRRRSPSLVTAPIMTNKMSLSEACRVEQGDDISSGGLDPVVRRRAGRAAAV